jgi:hypothetical protein
MKRATEQTFKEASSEARKEAGKPSHSIFKMSYGQRF